MVSTRQEYPGYAPGTILGERFRIVRPVGAGGMGIVYEAIDLKLDRQLYREREIREGEEVPAPE